MSTVPHDIMDGQPIRYRKTETAFVVYSLGANQVDDGGTLGEDKSRRRNPWRGDQGDWTWAYSPEDLEAE